MQTKKEKNRIKIQQNLFKKIRLDENPALFYYIKYRFIELVY